jgi:spermidine synthase
VTLFVQLYESNTEAVKSEIATFMKVFPNGIVWGNTNNGAGYDLVLLGQVEDTKIRVDDIQAKLMRPDYAPIRQSLREIGMNSAVDLFATFAGRASDLKPWLADAVINRDRNLRLQFFAGMGLNLYQSDVIYSGMLAYAHRFPDELFVASPETMNALRAGILREQGRQ